MAWMLNGAMNFVLIGPLDVIREETVGWDAAAVIYPSVSSCTTVTLYNGAAGMAGFHVTMGTTQPKVAALLDRAATHLGGVTHIVHAGRLTQSLPGGWNTFNGLQWPQQAATMRAMIPAPAAASRSVDTPVGMQVNVKAYWHNNGPAIALSPDPNALTPGAAGWAQVALT
ncbi:hypothetical protein [Vannielia litorea]|uniref:Uncharacterized protein n=1 Tax=Vannielia litorea TaxID=1217970 RepID=A0A1N6FM82_9RHOB|nr:hypothetical protein [Vannielia litorea]SIN96358.1 hypothetical protein SAMN05444002_1785 [Vannielia litorea]